MRKFLVTLCLAGLGACVAGAPAPDAANPASDVQRTTIGGTGLIGQTSEGMARICRYQGIGSNGEPRELRTGLAQRCPFAFPAADPRSLAPTTAVLDGSTVERGRRSCEYVLEPNRWTITLPLTETCPLNAGMARQAAERAESNSRVTQLR